MKKSILVYSFILLMLVAFSCVEDVKPASEANKFIRIFDHTEFNASFKAIDLKQTPDGGYIVLASRSFEQVSGQMSNQ